MKSTINKILPALFLLFGIAEFSSCSSSKNQDDDHSLSGGIEKPSECDKFRIYYNRKTDTYIYKKRNTTGAYFIYHNANDDKYYIQAESNLYRTRLMYKPPAYDDQETALVAAMTMNKVIALDDDLSMHDGQGNSVSIKKSVETICD